MQPLNEIPTPPGQPPPGYREVLYWKITEKKSRTLLMNLLSFPLFILSSIVFIWLAVNVGRMPKEIDLSIPAAGMPVLLALLLVLVLHELVHGLCMRFFGAHPKYGILWKALAFYATSPGYAFPRWQYLIIALAPLVALSLLAVLLMILLAGTAWVALIAFVAAVNAAGAIGDLWITTIVLRYPAYAYMMDERDGVRVFLPCEGSVDRPS